MYLALILGLHAGHERSRGHEAFRVGSAHPGSKIYANENIVGLVKFFHRGPRLNRFKGFLEGEKKTL